jgi:hypothetical protein
MRYKVAWLLVAALFTGTAASEERPDQRGDRLARMQEHLQLSDEQVAEMRRIRDSGGTRKEMFAVLDDSQRARLEEHRAHRKGWRGDRAKEERGDDPAEN